jgi:hypothetical protein
VTSQQGSHSLKSVNRCVDALHHSVDVHSVDVHSVNLSGGSWARRLAKLPVLRQNSHSFGFMETILTIAWAVRQAETALLPFVHETLKEFQVESCEDQDDADIDYQPSPEQVSEEH